jgi:hypothetical protein
MEASRVRQLGTCAAARKRAVHKAGPAAAALAAATASQRDDFSLNRHPAPAYRLCAIFSENRHPLFGIMH